MGVGRAEVLADRSSTLLEIMEELRGEVRLLCFCIFFFNMCKTVLVIGEGSQPGEDVKGCEMLRKSIERICLIHRCGMRV